MFKNYNGLFSLAYIIIRFISSDEMKGIIISKIRKFATEHPRLMTYGLVLAITLAIGVAIGTLEQHQAFALRVAPDCPLSTGHPRCIEF